MVKFVIDGQKEDNEPELYAWLSINEGPKNLVLWVANKSTASYRPIAYVDHDDGMLHIPAVLCKVGGIKTDEDGHIVVAGYKRINDD